MNYLLLLLSIFSMVLQNGIFNSVSKKYLKKKTDILYYNSILYFVCVILFGACALMDTASIYTVITGIFFGLVTILGNFYKMQALQKGPMHITVLIITSSMIIPTMSGVLLFDEKFSLMKLVVVFVLIFFIYLSLERNGDTRYNHGWIFSCFAAFFSSGIIGVIQKIHQNSVHKDELFSFLAMAFLVSFIFTFIISRKKGTRVVLKKSQYMFALLCGGCTFVMNLINLKLSGLLPSQLFFPLVNGSAIIITSIVSIVLFKEKTTFRQSIGLVGGFICLIAICFV